MTKKIKFLESNFIYILSFLNVTTNKLYEITGEKDTCYECVADNGDKISLLKLDFPVKYEIIEEPKPVKKYIKITNFDHPSNDWNKGVTLNKSYEITQEGSNHYDFLADGDVRKTVMKTESGFTISQGHPHADLIQYAADRAKAGDNLEELFQIKLGSDWVDYKNKPNGIPDFRTNHEYRIKPKTIKIGDVEINAPEREPLNCGQKYYLADTVNGVTEFEWLNDDSDKTWLKQGIVFLKEEDAIAASKEMLKLLKDK